MANISAYTANMTGFNYTLNDQNSTYNDPAYQTMMAAQEHVRNVILGFSLATFVFGFTGNSLVIYIIGHYTSERMKSVANYYIWSLAFADELFVLSLPMFCWATFTNQWPITGVLGNISCKIAYACRDITKFASAWTMVALSIDRLLASYYNLGHLRSIRTGKIVVICIWIVCALVSLHYFVHAKTLANSCRLDDSYGWFWTIMQLLLNLVLPSIGIFIPYILLSKRMKYRMLNRAGSTNSSRSNPSRCMNRTVFVVVTAFTLCQTPYYVVQIIYKAMLSEGLGRSLVHANRLMYANAVSQILVFVSSCCNPIIYGLLNYNFRRLYGAVLCRCCNQTWCCLRDCSGAAVNLDHDPLHSRTMETSRLTFDVQFHWPFHSKNRKTPKDKCSITQNEVRAADNDNSGLEGNSTKKQSLENGDIIAGGSHETTEMLNSGSQLMPGVQESDL